MFAWLRIKLRYEDETEKVKDRTRKASFQSIKHAAGAVRKTAQRSIREAPKGKASPPGKPPRTRGKRRLRESIGYHVESPLEAIVGPTRFRVGESGAAHEFGGKFRGDEYPARPYMRPALEKMRSRLPAHWRDSVRR